MPTLRLSFRRAEVAAFWALGTVSVAMLSGAAAAALGARSPWAWAAAAGVALLVPRLFWAPWFETGVWFWNGSVRHAAAALRHYVLVISYYVLFAAVGRSGSSLELMLRQPGASKWSPWRPRQHRPGHEGSEERPSDQDLST